MTARPGPGSTSMTTPPASRPMPATVIPPRRAHRFSVVVTPAPGELGTPRLTARGRDGREGAVIDGAPSGRDGRRGRLASRPHGWCREHSLTALYRQGHVGSRPSLRA